jgi:hypothetical protein
MTERAAPLSAEEPVAVRIARRLLDPGTPHTRHERESLALAHLPDILATLDAARAERQPSVEEVAAALRELDWVPERTALNDHIPWETWERQQTDSMAAALHARLFSARPSPSGSIDVEVLARALYRVERGDVLPTTERRETYRRQKAEAIAAEYARLTEADREEHPE